MMVKQNVDIWSFGCILAEAAVWLIHGYPGLENFRLSRRAAISAISNMKGGDWFHDGTKVLPIVLETMDNLKNDFRKSDQVTGPILDTLVMVMLDEPDVRYTAKQAHTYALRILPRPIIAISPVTGHSRQGSESFPPAATVVTPTAISGSDSGRLEQKPEAVMRLRYSVEESTATRRRASAADVQNISNLSIPSPNGPNHERRSSFALPSRSSLPADRLPTQLGPPFTLTVSNALSTSYVRPKSVPNQPNQPGQPELPKLDIDVAERWIRDMRAGKPRKLPGDYLLARLATRDHVCISLLLCFQPLTLRRYS
jgi:serine/threonine protein kinase